MEDFPFDEEEWSLVKEASRQILNATLADDLVLSESLLPILIAALESLRQRYGEHPVLLETEADFITDPIESVRLYRDAKQLAQANNLPIASICISLAGTLLNEFNQPEKAREELVSCQSEVDSLDEYDRPSWHRLMEDCEVALRSRPRQ